MTMTMQHSPVQAVTDADFRAAMGRFASGVTVITTSVGDRDYGATVSAFSSVSNDPPSVLVCLNSASETQWAVAAAGTFVVNVLAGNQDAVALRFARKGDDKFAGLGTVRSRAGLPVLTDVHVALHCRVVQAMESGTHVVFVGEVEAIDFGAGTVPLAYHASSFGRFLPAQRRGAKEVLRFDPALEHDLW